MNSSDTSSIFSSKRAIFWTALVLVVILAGVLSLNSFSMYYFNEDVRLISFVKDLSFNKAFSRIWGMSLGGNTGEGGLYRPITLSSIYLDYRVWGLDHHGYHFRNFTLNLVAVALVFLLAYRLFQKNILAAFCAASIFAVHPAHPSTVFWISARGDLFCTVLYLGGLVFLLIYLQKGWFSFVIISAIAFLLALFSKEMAVSAPAVAIALAFAIPMNCESRKKRLLPVIVSTVFPVIIYFSIRWAVLGSLIGSGEAYTFPSVRYFPVNLAKAAGFLLVPFGHTGAEGLLFSNKKLFLVLTGIVFLAGIVFLFYLVLRDRKNLAFILAIFFSIVPALGMTMRWHTYLPSALLAVFIGKLFADYRKKTRIQAFIIWIVIFGLFSFGYSRAAVLWEENAFAAKWLLFDARSQIEDLSEKKKAVFFALPSKINRLSVFTNGFDISLKTLYEIDIPVLEILPAVYTGEYESCDYYVADSSLVVSFDSEDSYFAPRVLSYLIGDRDLSEGQMITTQDGLEVEILELNSFGRVKSAAVDLRQSVFQPLGDKVFLVYFKGTWCKLGVL